MCEILHTVCVYVYLVQQCTTYTQHQECISYILLYKVNKKSIFCSSQLFPRPLPRRSKNVGSEKYVSQQEFQQRTNHDATLTDAKPIVMLLQIEPWRHWKLHVLTTLSNYMFVWFISIC